MEVVALVVAGLALAWQVGDYVSRKTKNTVDDALFQHPEVRDAVIALVEKLLARKK